MSFVSKILPRGRSWIINSIRDRALNPGEHQSLSSDLNQCRGGNQTGTVPADRREATAVSRRLEGKRVLKVVREWMEALMEVRRGSSWQGDGLEVKCVGSRGQCEAGALKTGRAEAFEERAAGC